MTQKLKKQKFTFSTRICCLNVVQKKVRSHRQRLLEKTAVKPALVNVALLLSYLLLSCSFISSILSSSLIFLYFSCLQLILLM